MKENRLINAAIIALVILTLILTFTRDVSAASDDAELIAKILYTECRGVESTTEQAAVAWVVLNRVDDERWPDTIGEVVKQEHQFAWNENAPVTKELLALAKDVLLRWELEKLETGEVGRVLPETFVYFAGRGGQNYFRTEYDGGEVWDWAMISPYEE